MKQTKFQKAKQKGFTLLELLVVITLLAILSVGALVAYEGIGETAQATAAANNTSGADRAIRNFRAVTQNYPDQWDNLVTDGTGVPLDFMANEGRAWLASMAMPAASATLSALEDAFTSVGITELQARTVATTTANLEPNLQHNEGAVLLADPLSTDVVEDDFVNMSHFAVLPSFGAAACTMTGATYPTLKLATVDPDTGLPVAGTAITADDGLRQNVINDNLEDDQCNLVVALGFGHDAAHSTQGSSVAVSTAPTFVSRNINPSTEYARYVALFHVAQDADEDGNIDVADIFPSARLLAVVDAEGNMIDENIADATTTSN
jgi:prepilin-type N-terminal cleavage/methylation domain-containing protein